MTINGRRHPDIVFLQPGIADEKAPRKKRKPLFPVQIAHNDPQFQSPSNHRPDGRPLAPQFRAAAMAVDKEIIADHIDEQRQDGIPESDPDDFYSPQTCIQDGGSNEKRKGELQDTQVAHRFRDNGRIQGEKRINS